MSTALTALVNQVPFNQLVAGVYTTIWLQDKGAGIFTISGRTKVDGQVRQLSAANGAALVQQVLAVTQGEKFTDVSVGGVDYGITVFPVVGGIEYVVTEHARIPPSQRGQPTDVI